MRSLLTALFQALPGLPPLDPSQVNGWLDLVAHGAMLGVGILGALITASTPAWPFVIPLVKSALVNRVKKEERASAEAGFDAVSRAGVIAASRFAQVQTEMLKRAMAPDSPGGVAITDEERREALAAGAAAAADSIPREDVAAALEGLTNRALEEMKASTAFSDAIKLYGSLDEVKAAIRRTLEAHLVKHPPPVPPTTAVSPSPPVVPAG